MSDKDAAEDLEFVDEATRLLQRLSATAAAPDNSELGSRLEDVELQPGLLEGRPAGELQPELIEAASVDPVVASRKAFTLPEEL